MVVKERIYRNLLMFGWEGAADRLQDLNFLEKVPIQTPWVADVANPFSPI
jgi:hypothetical protein